jgi:ferredoxin
MPELRVGDRLWSVAAGSNLLDALNQNGVPVPYSCRAGSCHACLVQCVQGLPSDSRPDALSAEQRQQGWRLACQCQVIEDLQVHTFDPQRDGQPAEVAAVDWLSASVLRLRLTRSGHCATAPASIWCCGRAMWRGLPRQPAAR